jgi:hypothetical protein
VEDLAIEAVKVQVPEKADSPDVLGTNVVEMNQKEDLE